jgi:hypothetical protein
MANFFRGTRYAIRAAHRKFKPTDLPGLELFLEVGRGFFQETDSPTTPSEPTPVVGSWVPVVGPTISAIADNRRLTRQTVSGKIHVQCDGLDDFFKPDDTNFIALFTGTDKPFPVALNFQFLDVTTAGTAPWDSVPQRRQRRFAFGKIAPLLNLVVFGAMMPTNKTVPAMVLLI